MVKKEETRIGQLVEGDDLKVARHLFDMPSAMREAVKKELEELRVGQCLRYKDEEDPDDPLVFFLLTSSLPGRYRVWSIPGTNEVYVLREAL